MLSDASLIDLIFSVPLFYLPTCIWPMGQYGYFPAIKTWGNSHWTMDIGNICYHWWCLAKSYKPSQKPGIPSLRRRGIFVSTLAAVSSRLQFRAGKYTAVHGSGSFSSSIYSAEPTTHTSESWPVSRTEVENIDENWWELGWPIVNVSSFCP